MSTVFTHVAGTGFARGEQRNAYQNAFQAHDVLRELRVGGAAEGAPSDANTPLAMEHEEYEDAKEEEPLYMPRDCELCLSRDHSRLRVPQNCHMYHVSGMLRAYPRETLQRIRGVTYIACGADSCKCLVHRLVKPCNWLHPSNLRNLLPNADRIVVMGDPMAGPCETPMESLGNAFRAVQMDVLALDCGLVPAGADVSLTLTLHMEHFRDKRMQSPRLSQTLGLYACGGRSMDSLTFDVPIHRTDPNRMGLSLQLAIASCARSLVVTERSQTDEALSSFLGNLRHLLTHDTGHYSLANCLRSFGGTFAHASRILLRHEGASMALLMLLGLADAVPAAGPSLTTLLLRLPPLQYKVLTTGLLALLRAWLHCEARPAKRRMRLFVQFHRQETMDPPVPQGESALDMLLHALAQVPRPWQGDLHVVLLGRDHQHAQRLIYACPWLRDVQWFCAVDPYGTADLEALEVTQRAP